MYDHQKVEKEILEFWNKEKIYEKAKKGEVKGFSIEGYFADKYDLNTETLEDLEERFTV